MLHEMLSEYWVCQLLVAWWYNSGEEGEEGVVLTIKGSAEL